MYYASKVLYDAEMRYTKIEKLGFPLLMAVHKIRPHFHAHTILVPTDQPLKRILQKLETSGRLMAWSMELGEFDIHHRPRPAIKGQALANFNVESTIPDEDPIELEDGDEAIKKHGASSIWMVHLISLKGSSIEYAIRFDFQASNNEAEYDADEYSQGPRSAEFVGLQ